MLQTDMQTPKVITAAHGGDDVNNNDDNFLELGHNWRDVCNVSLRRSTCVHTARYSVWPRLARPLQGAK